MELSETERKLISKLLNDYAYTQLLLSDRFKDEGYIAEHYDAQKESDDAIELSKRILND